MELLELIKEKKIKEAVDLIKEAKPEPKVSINDIKSQYIVNDHNVFQNEKRPKKVVFKEKLDNYGNPILQKNDNGEEQPVKERTEVDVNRIGVSFQELIVDRAVGILLTNPVQLSPVIDESSEGQRKVVKMVEQLWVANKMDYKIKQIATRMFSECEVAALFYLVEPKQSLWQRISSIVGLSNQPKFMIRHKICSPFLNDNLYPVFDATGDMVSFSREYVVTETVDGEKKKVTRMDTYTEEHIYKWKKGDDDWKEVDERPVIPNPFKKIPAVYWKQDYPDWHKVQSMIDRFEKLVSNFGDTNDYFASPILFLKGIITGMANKDDRGKVISGDKDAEGKYLEWAAAPEAIKLEIETLEKLIYSLTQTPDISFEKLKNIGSQISGIALKVMLSDSHMKASKKEEAFGEGVQRMINIIKASVGNVLSVGMAQDVIMTEIKPEFTFFLPENTKEEIEILSTAKSSGIISTQTAVERNPLVLDAEEELDRIKDDHVNDLSGSFV